MPRVQQRSTMETSFEMDAVDSQLFMSANERKFVNQLEEEVVSVKTTENCCETPLFDHLL